MFYLFYLYRLYFDINYTIYVKFNTNTSDRKSFKLSILSS